MTAIGPAHAGHRFRLNVAANFIGSGWTAAAQLLCVPLYVQLLGVEAYGLIGFYVTLRAALLVLDLGLATTVNREMARLSVDESQAQKMRDLARTLEIGYWILGGVLAALLIALAPSIATGWVNVRNLSPSQVTRTLMMVGVLIGLQWPLSFYQGGLMGLQRQVPLNSLKVLDATLSTAGAVLVLRFINRDIGAFFDWQIGVSALHLFLVHGILWRSLGGTGAERHIQLRSLGSIRAFALGMSGISVLGIVITQMDKIVLSRLLPLQAFGYYMLADTLANGMYLFITPVFGALYPRLAAQVAAADTSELRDLYHGGTQLLAVLMLPVAAVLSLCPAAAITAWTGDAESVPRIAPILRLLVLGTALNGLMHIPYALQLAYGWTRIGVLIRGCQLLLFLPLLLLLAALYGGTGAASVWLAMNASYFMVGAILTHRRLLIGDVWRWLGVDVGLPAVAAFVMVGALSRLPSFSGDRVQILMRLAGMCVAALIAAALAAPRMRTGALRMAGVRP
jgi:O-antigen/teichoic acid export membrane protein